MLYKEGGRGGQSIERSIRVLGYSYQHGTSARDKHSVVPSISTRQDSLTALLLGAKANPHGRWLEWHNARNRKTRRKRERR